jgi:hypothetical protein
LGVFLLVGLRGELEAGVQIRFGDFVVVIEEFLGLGHGVHVVGFGSELVRMLP